MVISELRKLVVRPAPLTRAEINTADRRERRQGNVL